VLVDSHCHLDMLDLAPWHGDLSGVIDAARALDVTHMLCVSVTLERWRPMMELIRPYANVYASVGVHPNEREGHDPSVAELVELARDPKIVAIGETGLDYYRSEGDVEWQRERFRRHIAAAKLSGKPLIIHMRDATDDTLRVLEEERADEIGGVMHCFANDWDAARRALDLGFYISFSGIVTFKNAHELREVAARVPSDRLLVETDSPYLAPVPQRGKPNYPGYTRYVAERIAEVRNVGYDEIARASTQNFFGLFAAAQALV
jgi:TatD DNase family protein